MTDLHAELSERVASEQWESLVAYCEDFELDMRHALGSTEVSCGVYKVNAKEQISRGAEAGQPCC